MSTAGPPQGAKAPLGGSDLHAVNERGGQVRTARTRVQRRPVHGVLMLDKPLGLSSNQALQKAKWLLRAEKAGHTGTLDPLATGVLPLCFGAATKFSQMQLDADKTYEATVRLGIKTSTGDAEGEILEQRPVSYTPEQLAAVLRQFTGPIRQVPPMHSALKKDGKALYEYAREGIEIEREPRDVVIHELSLLAQRDEPHAIDIRVCCSKGTYIRTLGEDIAQALGCGGHLSALRRTATGPFGLTACITLPALEAMTEAERQAHVLPVDSLLPEHRRVALDAPNAARFLSGLRRRGDWADGEQVAVYGPLPSPQPSPKGRGSEYSSDQARASLTHDFEVGCLLGTAHVLAGELIPTRLLSPIDIQQILESLPQATQPA